MAAPPGSSGAESKRMLERVLSTNSRPPDNDNTKLINNLYELIEKQDLIAAQEILNTLIQKLGSEDPALIQAQTIIENRSWEKEVGL